jgi:hypothetical protein
MWFDSFSFSLLTCFSVFFAFLFSLLFLAHTVDTPNGTSYQ